MPEVDPIDVLLRIQNLRKFVADAEVANAAVKKVATAGVEGSAAAGATGTARSKAAADAQRAAALGLVRKAAIGTGLAVAGIGFESAKMAIKFDESMLRLTTQAGESKKHINALSGSVLDMAHKVGIGPQSLADGLYHLVSVGLRWHQSLKALKVASDLAGVGHANLEETSNALAAAWVTGIKGAGNFTHVAALMNAAVGSGNIRMNELAEALGTGILPAARVAGLSIQNVFAAISTLTDAGWKASSASAQLATAFHYLYSPTKKAQGALAEMHLTGLQLIELMKTRGLPFALRTLRDHLAQYTHGKTPQEKQSLEAQKLAEIVPGGRGRSLLSLITMIPRLEKKEAFEQNATNKKFAGDVAAYHKTAAFQIRAAWAGVQADLIRIGKLLEPVAVLAVKALKALADSLLWVVNAVKTLKHEYEGLSPLLKGVIIFFGLIAGQAGAFIGIIFAWKMLKDVIMASKIAIQLFSAASKIALLTSPWGIMIMAIVALVVIMMTHWKESKQVLLEIWGALRAAWKATVGWIVGAANDTFNWFKSHWPMLAAILGGPFGIAVYMIIRHWNGIMKFFESIPAKLGRVASTIWNAFTWPFRWALQTMEHLWNKFIKLPGVSQIMGAIKWVGSGLESAASAVTGLVPGLALGGVLSTPGTVVVGERGPEILSLPRGASVQPLSTRASGIEGTVMLEVHHQTVLDGKVLTDSVGSYTANRIARR